MTLAARLLTAAALLAVTGAALISGASGAQAATFVVTTSDDGADVSLGDGVCGGSPEVSVDCTLRAAIQEANANPDVDTIILPSRPDPFVLTEEGTGPGAGDLNIDSDLTISGGGPHQSRIVALWQGAFGGRVLAISATATATVRGVMISGGEACGAGGGVFNAGDLTLTTSIVQDSLAERGGGIANTGTLRIENTTVTNNRSVVVGADPSDPRLGTGQTGGGGILSTAGTMTVTNSTVSRNSAPGSGGGVLNDGTSSASLLHVTITDNNMAGGLESRAPLTLQNTIVSGSADAACTPATTTITSNGGNVANDLTCSAFLTAVGDQNGVDPLLGPLVVDSATEVHALLAGSPAIDAAVGCTPPDTDQRRVTRPQGAACDTGAFERSLIDDGPPTPPPPIDVDAEAPPPKSSCTIVGTPGPDVLIGTRKRDIICGLGGDDRIVGRGGSDTLVGGSGRDFIIGGRGRDGIWGDKGRDELRGGLGADRIRGGRGHDLVIGGPGRDTLRGGKGRDRPVWTRGRDRIFSMEAWPKRLIPELKRLQRLFA